MSLSGYGRANGKYVALWKGARDSVANGRHVHIVTSAGTYCGGADPTCRNCEPFPPDEAPRISTEGGAKG